LWRAHSRVQRSHFPETLRPDARSEALSGADNPGCSRLSGGSGVSTFSAMPSADADSAGQPVSPAFARLRAFGKSISPSRGRVSAASPADALVSVARDAPPGDRSCERDMFSAALYTAGGPCCARFKISSASACGLSTLCNIRRLASPAVSIAISPTPKTRWLMR
jgi:hypothetical protein